MDTDTRDIVVPEGSICVEERGSEILIYKKGQTVRFSVMSCVLLGRMESTTAIRCSKVTDVPSIGEGTWTRTERERITNVHGASLSEIIDKTEWRKEEKEDGANHG